MVYHHLKHRNEATPMPKSLENEEEYPIVTIQLPVYNEVYVVRRVIDSTCALNYPQEKLEIQVLDDSTDETTSVIAETIVNYQRRGFDIKHIRRGTREGFKAGALKKGLETARGEFVAVFDADFVVQPDFLQDTLPYFSDAKTGMVQTRWEHLNGESSMLTRAQAMALDGHFMMEQNVRNRAGYFINFNGTAGIWRKECIFDAGNWEGDTLTEDLDLSYRAQLNGWKFKFLPNVTSPAELPSEINALKSQQFRWTKGAIEVAWKLLPKVWKSNVSLNQKIHSTFHLTNNIVFPFILIAGILNVPIVFIKHQGGFETYFSIMSIFVLSFVGSFMFYFYGQKEIYEYWQRRIVLFPLFMAGSMGFAVNNTKAVIEGVIRKKSEFVRTPKYNLVDSGTHSIAGSATELAAKKYVPNKIKLSVFFELLLALYFVFGLLSSLYFLEFAAIPFQALFFMGFSFTSILSLKQNWLAKRKKNTAIEPLFAE
jgi:cellulose synthase/poly-beta-1,6-N-acetylglucosamine synthase-like glycosyltransferase